MHYVIGNGMKCYTRCDKERLLTEFHREGQHFWCKFCVKEYDHIRHEKNAVKIRAQKKARIKRIRNWYREYKSNLFCTRCTVSHPAVIEFHHVSGDKTECISIMVLAGYGIDRILEEMQKCEVVCSNCHKIEHWKES